MATNEPSSAAQANATRERLPRKLALSDLTAKLAKPQREDAERARRMAEADKAFEQCAREAVLETFLGSVGARYRNATFPSYTCRHPGQEEVLRGLRAYAENFPQHRAAGDGILLFGPPGTGKDHLLVALARAVFASFAPDQRCPIAWRNGADLFGAIRDLIGSECKESEFIGRLVAPAVLILSDPLQPIGPLSEHQATMLCRIIDGRYRACRPTWVSLNVAHGDEASDRLSPQVTDRLRDGTILAYCNWPSYRKPARQLWTGGEA